MPPPRSASWLPALALLVGLAVTVTLALVSQSQYTDNEKRLLHLRVRDAGALVTESLPGVQAPLASAAALADTTNGNAGKFMRLARAYVGSRPGRLASLSVWRLDSLAQGPVLVAGLPPKLARSGSAAATLFAAAARGPQLQVIGLLSEPDPKLGYAMTAPGVSGGWVAYAENPLPANRRSRLQSSNQFAGLHYAIYLGNTQARQSLLVSDVAGPTLPGRRDSVTVPFGNSALTLAMSTQHPLAGTLPERLPWIIAIIGGLLSLAAAALTSVLVRRRRSAEALAKENRELYTEQRSIAQTLQHSLLPDHLPELSGVTTSGRYEAGELGLEVGGDWYDVIDVGERRLLLVIGDVAGRGLRAATAMARLRYAIHAYAFDDHEPAAILSRLSRLTTIERGDQLATVLCALIDVDDRSISVASAGHLPPLLIHNGSGEFIESPTGLPIGVEPEQYRSVTVCAPPAATLLAYTDGLIEHRGEHLDQSLERLRKAASGRDAALSDLLGTLVSELQSRPGADDIAIVGLQWMS